MDCSNAGIGPYVVNVSAGKVHPVNYLFQRLGSLRHYHDGVIPVCTPMEGTAFFPGGSGLWREDRPSGPLPPLPIGKVMVLAHNFGCERDYEPSRRGESLRCPTWRNLLHLLEECCIRREDCFFTDFYMGLLKGNRSVGKFPSSKEFDKECQRFLTEQINVQQPRLILTLGAVVPPVIAPLSPELARWRDCGTLKELDAQQISLIPSATFPNSDVRSTVAVAALTHPCMPNISHRRYRGCSGAEAQSAILVDALPHAGLAA